LEFSKERVRGNPVLFSKYTHKRKIIEFLSYLEIMEKWTYIKCNHLEKILKYSGIKANPYC